MNAALQDFRTIWRVATAQRDTGAMRTLVLAGAAVVACALIIAVLGHLETAPLLRFLVAVGAGVLALAWSFVFVPGSIRMNSPINAWMLPHQRRRLLQMTAAYWFVATLGVAFGIGAWDALPLVALATLGVPLLSAGNRVVPVLLIVGGNWFWLARVALPPAWAQVVTGDAAMAVLGVLLLPGAVWGLRWLYPAGGDAYLDRIGAQVRRMGAFHGCAEDKQALANGLAVQGSPPLYRWAMRRDVRRADPGAMLGHALGPVAHWTGWLGGILIILLFGAAARVALAWSQDTDVLSLVDSLVKTTLAVQALVIALTMARHGQQLRRTRGEQALLRLTPLAGDAALLNRRLGARLLRQALTCWVALIAAAFVAAFLAGATPDALLRQLGLCCLGGQVALMGLLDDYARADAGWTLERGLRAAALAAVQAFVAVGLGWLTGTTAWPWLVVLPPVVCCVLLRRDWRRMLAAPPAFPAGRME